MVGGLACVKQQWRYTLDMQTRHQRERGQKGEITPHTEGAHSTSPPTLSAPSSAGETLPLAPPGCRPALGDRGSAPRPPAHRCRASFFTHSRALCVTSKLFVKLEMAVIIPRPSRGACGDDEEGNGKAERALHSEDVAEAARYRFFSTQGYQGMQAAPRAPDALNQPTTTNRKLLVRSSYKRAARHVQEALCVPEGWAARVVGLVQAHVRANTRLDDNG